MTCTPLIMALALLAGACSNKENAVPSHADWSAVRANLAFTCVREADHLPPLNPRANDLFKYGRYLEKKDGPKDYALVARYYRIAAAQGHYKANNNLQQLVSTGLAPSPDAPNEILDLAEQLIAAGIPAGYYDMGHYLELGYGVKQDQEKALRYFRKAADLGSPEAQLYISNLLAPLEKAPAGAKQMRQCATDQGLGEAANTLGVDLMADKLYSDALNAFQKGVKAGDTMRTGAICPQDGIWSDRYWAKRNPGATRRFTKGETMPQIALAMPRIIPVLDALLGERMHWTDADWSLVAHDEQA